MKDSSKGLKMWLLKEIYLIMKDLKWELRRYFSAGCVIKEEGKYLAVSRPEDPSSFSFPCGKVEFRESSEQAALRELQEETDAYGIIEEKIFVDKTPHLKKPCVFYKVQLTVAPILGKNKEGCEVKWATEEELCSGSYGPHNKRLFNAIQKPT